MKWKDGPINLQFITNLKNSYLKYGDSRLSWLNLLKKNLYWYIQGLDPDMDSDDGYNSSI